MSAHDVRNLGTCCLCHKLGSFDPRLADVALLLVLRTGYGRRSPRVGAHPRCLVRGTGKNANISFITALGVEEMGKIRRTDLSDVIYRRVLLAHDTQCAVRERLKGSQDEEIEVLGAG